MVNSSTQGEYLDSPRAKEFFSSWWISTFPCSSTRRASRSAMRRWRSSACRRWWADRSTRHWTLARFILMGGFVNFPQLKLIMAHMGGAITAARPPRLRVRAARRRYLRTVEPDVLQGPPSTYIEKLYVDTMGFHPPAVMCCVGTVGVEHVVMGSDHPPVHVPHSRTVDVVRNLPLSVDDRAKILVRTLPIARHLAAGLRSGGSHHSRAGNPRQRCG